MNSRYQETMFPAASVAGATRSSMTLLSQSNTLGRHTSVVLVLISDVVLIVGAVGHVAIDKQVGLPAVPQRQAKRASPACLLSCNRDLGSGRWWWYASPFPPVRSD